MHAVAAENWSTRLGVFQELDHPCDRGSPLGGKFCGIKKDSCSFLAVVIGVVEGRKGAVCLYGGSEPRVPGFESANGKRIVGEEKIENGMRFPPTPAVTVRFCEGFHTFSMGAGVR